MRLRQLANCLAYVVTDHRRIDGVTLSLRGQWGNIPYPDDASAEAAARVHAGAARHSIERVKV